MVKRSLAVLIPTLAVVWAAMVYLGPPQHEALDTRVQPVNAVLGDRSFVERFGRMPDRTTDEDLRIRTHLEYVEHLLRARPMDGLTPAQRRARALNLDRLHAYWTRGIFPRNDSGIDRRLPTFIDGQGRICAVGYLVEQSAGRAVAEAINRQYKYSYIADMHSPVLDAWAAASGLTQEELAMIQPGYYGGVCIGCIQPEQPKPNPAPEMIAAAFNGGMTLLNGIDALRGAPSYAVAGLGLATGASGLALGLRDDSNYRTADVLLGGASLLLSSFNLTRRLQRSRTGARSALVPEARATVVPGKSLSSGTSVRLRWTF